MKVMLSVSALQPSQYRTYARGWKPNQKLLEIFEAQSLKRGKKAYRVYFDYGSDRPLRISESNVPKAIMAYFEQNKITLLDYVAGTATDSHGRTVRIGKLLSKQPELKKVFDNDPSRRQLVTVSKGNKLVCLSMHPYDIAGMSTDRGWTSCMNLVDGGNKKYVRQDIKANVLIAYLINDTDKNINRPIARVLIKPFKNSNGSTVRYIVEQAYPDAKDKTFVKHVQKWVDENINSVTDAKTDPALLRRPSSLYDDGVGDFIITGIDKLASLGADALDSALNKILDKKIAIAKKKRMSAANLPINEKSVKELFKKIPNVLAEFPNLVKLTGYNTVQDWMEANRNNPNTPEIIKRFMSRKGPGWKDTSNPDALYGLLIKEKDFKVISSIQESVSVDEFLERSDEVHYLINGLFANSQVEYNPTSTASIMEICSGLASFSKNPDKTFWSVLGQTENKQNLQFQKEDPLEMEYQFQQYLRLKEMSSQYMNLASLEKAKKFLAKPFYNLWKLILSDKIKAWVEISYLELGMEDLNGYDAYDALENIGWAVTKIKPQPIGILGDASRMDMRTSLYLLFDKEVVKTQVINSMRDELGLNRTPQVTAQSDSVDPDQVSQDLQMDTGTLEGKYDVRFRDRSKEEWLLSDIASDYDVQYKILAVDPVSHIPTVRIMGFEDDMEMFMNAYKDMMRISRD